MVITFLVLSLPFRLLLYLTFKTWSGYPGRVQPTGHVWML